MSKITMTAEYQSAINAIDNGSPCVFISGEAGSGKTTLLHYMTEYYSLKKKNIALAAATGTAALQAGGVTINSLFRFPPRILAEKDIIKPKNSDLFKAMDILFLDEASFIRVDVMDAIDISLRKARRNNKPFGGVQIVLIGDLFQLPPVVTPEDKIILNQLGYTRGFYFFNALVFTKIPLRTILLTQGFRQDDAYFKQLLNKVRVADDSRAVVAKLNEVCYVPSPKISDMTVTLATTNAIADEKNRASLSMLPGTPYVLNAEREGNFTTSGNNLPSPEKLVLKVGAVVMFTANDPDKCWVNGMMGKVKAVNKATVEVITEGGSSLLVGQHEWKSYELSLNNGKIEQKQTGSYKQFPLMLGWAITIHKSQGKTIKHLHINLGTGAFTTGQTYVALSRAVSMQGMTFERPLQASDIKACPIVKKFLEPEEFALT